MKTLKCFFDYLILLIIPFTFCGVWSLLFWVSYLDIVQSAGFIFLYTIWFIVGSGIWFRYREQSKNLFLPNQSH